MPARSAREPFSRGLAQGVQKASKPGSTLPGLLAGSAGPLARAGLIHSAWDGSVHEPGMFAARSERRYLGGAVLVAGGVVVVVAGGVP
jgi:hypothetical protein